MAERLNALEADRMIFLQAAIGSVLSKQGAKHFKEILKGLRDHG